MTAMKTTFLYLALAVCACAHGVVLDGLAAKVKHQYGVGEHQLGGVSHLLNWRQQNGRDTYLSLTLILNTIFYLRISYLSRFKYTISKKRQINISWFF